MEQVAKDAGFPSREAMIADMRSNPKWFFKTDRELLEATALQAKVIDGKMPTSSAACPPALRHPSDGSRHRARRHHRALPAGQP
jgi:uncharacterized protein (DUF885 family)